MQADFWRIFDGSWPAFSKAALSSGLQPLSLSNVNTRFVVVSQNIFGTLKSGSPLKFSASSDAAAASMRISISSAMVFANICTTFIG